MSRLELRGLTVRFGTGRRTVLAVDGVDLDVPHGSVLGLVGGSGSGKSTIARAAVGLVRPASGSVLVDGVDVTSRRGRRAAERRRLQMVFQDPSSSLNPRMSAGASIEEALIAAGRGSRLERRRETRRLLELVHLDPGLESALPARLSGGQCQRVALARALAAQPTVLIADEITSALDVSVQGALLNLVLELRRALELTIVFVSHDLALVRYVSDAIAVMHQGRIVENAPADEVLSEPRTAYTRELLASVLRLGVPLEATP